MIGSSPHPRRLTGALFAVAVLLLLGFAAPLAAQTPAATPAGSGGTVIGSVRIASGNELPRNAGQENQPPVWLTVDSKGSSAVVTVGNATRQRVDFGGAGVTITLAPGVDATNVLVSTGSAAIQGNQVIWNGFSLNSGQIVPAIVGLSAPESGSPPEGPAISGISIEAMGAGGNARVSELVAGGGPASAALDRGRTPASSASARSTDPPLTQTAARRYATFGLGLLGAMLLALLALAVFVMTLARRQGLAALESRVGGLQTGIDGLTASVAGLQGAVESRKPERFAPEPYVPGAPEAGTAGELEVEEGAEPGRRWRLSEGGVTIGRDPRSTIVLADPRVSGSHARLSLEPSGRCLLVDEGSTNGTAVNSRLVTEPVPLKDGDRVRIGGTTFVYRAAARSH
jgi:FHA domain